MGSFIHVYTDGGGIREARVPDDYAGKGSQAFVLKFPGFRKSLLASLVPNSTASRASGVVTITATAHGVITGSTYAGFRFFYPGSPSLAAGWYNSITDVQTNTISFNAPGANFGSESVNGAAAYTSETELDSLVLPGSDFIGGLGVTVNGFRGGDTTAASKQMRYYIQSLNVHTDTVTTAPFVAFICSFYLGDSSIAYGVSGFDNIPSATRYQQPITLGIDSILSVRGSVGSAGGFMHITNLSAQGTKGN